MGRHILEQKTIKAVDDTEDSSLAIYCHDGTKVVIEAVVYPDDQEPVLLCWNATEVREDDDGDG